MRENDYEGMPPVEETQASYLSVGETSSLKAPSLQSKPLQEKSYLNGRAYAAAGQAVASLHTMAVLQAYQGDLLKDLDKGQDLSPDEVAELRAPQIWLAVPLSRPPLLWAGLWRPWWKRRDICG